MAADMEAVNLYNASEPKFEAGPKNCTFPFRYRDILYYACTNLEAGGKGPFNFCATKTDTDFNAQELGVCDTENRCPIQREYSRCLQ